MNKEHITVRRCFLQVSFSTNRAENSHHLRRRGILGLSGEDLGTLKTHMKIEYAQRVRWVYLRHSGNRDEFRVRLLIVSLWF